jgi:hypothetical protein
LSLTFFVFVIVILVQLLDQEESGYVIQNSAEYEITGESTNEIGEVYLQEYDVGINIHIDDVANDNTKSIEYNEDIMKYIEINFLQDG